MNSRPAHLAGYIIVIVSALAFAGNNAFAVLSYGGGTTPLTLITMRMLFALAAIAVFLRLTGVPLALPAPTRNAALALGILNGTMAYCLISAFHYIDVGLAILVFYLYPVLIAVGAWATGQERLNRGIVIGLAGAFAGLVLALEVSATRAATTGLLLAAAAAVLMAGVGLAGARVLRTDNARSVTLHMHISASALFVLVSVAAGELTFPTTVSGWVGFAGVPLFYTIAITTFFAAIPLIGAVRASLVMNLEPVASIALGFIVLGQVLTGQQLLGAAIVIGAVTAIKWMKWGGAAPAPRPAAPTEQTGKGAP